MKESKESKGANKKESSKSSLQKDLSDALSVEKQEALNQTIKSLERSHGSGILRRMGSEDVIPIEVIPSGSIGLNRAMGIGGYPKGRIVEIYGPESSGKTTLALHAIAEAQKEGGICAFIDAEHALDVEYAKSIGVNIDNLYLSQPGYGEQALEVAEELISSKAISLIVIDSVAALVPKAEVEGSMGDAHMAMHARLMSQALRKLTAILGRSGTIMVFINQLRQKIGVVFGNPETTTGGNALKFYASLRIDVRKIETLKRGEEMIGSRTRVKIVKNKMAAPYQQTCFDILYGVGISKESEVIELATEMEILEKSGSWYSYKKERLVQGQENLRKILLENPILLSEIEKEVIDKMNLMMPDIVVEEKTPLSVE